MMRFLLFAGGRFVGSKPARFRPRTFCSCRFVGRPTFDQFPSAVDVPGAHKQFGFDDLGESALRVAV
jgi:hypothetical protein